MRVLGRVTLKYFHVRDTLLALQTQVETFSTSSEYTDRCDRNLSDMYLYISYLAFMHLQGYMPVVTLLFIDKYLLLYYELPRIYSYKGYLRNLVLLTLIFSAIYFMKQNGFKRQRG